VLQVFRHPGDPHQGRRGGMGSAGDGRTPGAHQARRQGGRQRPPAPLQRGWVAPELRLARDKIRWLVIFGRPPMWAGGPSITPFERALANERTELGRYRLERLPVGDKLPAVFRVRSRAGP
jgi:hypothetical protein